MNVSKLKFWNGIVEQIWLRSCSTARIRPEFDDPGGRGNGHSFCAKMADVADCVVIAPTEKQVTGISQGTLPPGMLDTYEGQVVCYGPNGHVISFFRFPSTYEIRPGDWHPNPD